MNDDVTQNPDPSVMPDNGMPAMPQSDPSMAAPAPMSDAPADMPAPAPVEGGEEPTAPAPM